MLFHARFAGRFPLLAVSVGKSLSQELTLLTPICVNQQVTGKSVNAPESSHSTLMYHALFFSTSFDVMEQWLR